MATPANRVPVRIARGSKANLDTAIAAGDLKEGEICYATDENGIYVVEGGVLTQAGADLAATSIDALSDVDTTTAAPTDGQVLIWNNVDGEWQPGDLSIDNLSDVDTTTAAPVDGQALIWNNSASQWEPGGVSGEIEWTLTANGSTDYIFAGAGFAGTETDPAIYVMRGQTYKFTNAMGAHPFQIQSTQGLGGTAYNDGITNNAVSNGTLTWEVRMDAPSTLYYQCTSHAGMNGTIYVLDEGGVTSVNTLTGAVSLGIEDMDDFQLQATPPVSAYHDAKQTDGDFNGSGTTTGGFALDGAGSGYTSIYINDDDPTSGTSLVSQGFTPGTSLDLWVSADGVNFTQHTAANSFTQGGQNAQFFNLSPNLSAYSSAGALYFSLTSVAGTPIALADNDILQYESATSKFRPVQLGVDNLSDIDTTTTPPTDGQALLWDSANSKWEPGTVSGGGGTTLPSANDGEALIYENGAWVAGPVIGGVNYTSPGGDASFNNVELLLLFNGTNGSTTFTDSSSNGLTVTASGNAQISTAEAKFGGASGYFDGTGDKIVVASNPGLAFGTSDDFTIEFWFRPTHNNAYEDGAILISDAATSYTTGVSMIIWNHPNVPNDISVWNYADSSNQIINTSSLTPGTWHHIALVRSGSTLNLYVDGTAGTSATSNGAWDFSNGGTAIGDYFGGGFGSNGSLDGYIDDLRVTKGVARYTSNFTAPTAELPSTGGTVTIPYSIDKLDDVDTSTVAPTDGQALLWDNTAQKWEPGTVASGSVASLDDIGDVDTTTVPPTDGQALVWDNAAGQWEPGTVSGGGGTTLPSANDGEALIYENGAWVAGPVIGGVSYTPSTTDADFSSVSLLLLFNGTNGSTTFTDSSSNGLTVTASGDAQISTAQSKFGGASGYFDGTGDKLNVASNSALNIGASDDFTIEFWIRPSASTRGGILSADGDTSFSGTVCTIEWDNSNEPDKVGIWNRGDSTSTYARATTPTLSLDTWYHVAFVRVGTTITVFTDGVAGATTGFSNSAFDFTNGGTAVGDVFGNSFNGYLDDLRVTKGVARYTSDFTPPTAELPASGAGGVNIPYSIDKLDDVDTSTVAPTDGQALVWDNTAQKWEPGAAVSSVNTQTGDVVLGIEDMDDFALQPGTFPYWATKEGTGTPAAGEWFPNGSNLMRANPVDSNGTDWSTEMTALGTTGTFWYSTDSINWTSTTNSGGFDNLPTWFQFNLAPFNVTTHTGGIYISFSDPASATGAPLADGDILQYVSADSKFKPAQASGVRSLLGIGEYADDTAAGTGGLSSGELYYNTTSSSYVLKT